MIRFTHRGSFNKAEKFLNNIIGRGYLNGLDKCGQEGADALAEATPSDSGLTAASWTHELSVGGGKTTLAWINTNENDGFNVAIGLQYGHGTGTGGYVPGQDYVNPAMAPVFDKAADEVWKEVTSG